MKIGVWENEKFIGTILFGRGANRFIGGPYGLTQLETCELTRVALTDHVTPVSRMLSIALKMLKKQSPGLRLVVSYADSDQEHYGGIYQASGWIYVGTASFEAGVRLNGEMCHRRTINSTYGRSDIEWLRKHVDPEAEVITGGGKHKYLYPLDAEIRERIERLRKNYPKPIDSLRATSIDGDAPRFQRDEGGSTPTVALLNHVSKN